MRRLLIRPGAIGDFIVSLPALQCLRHSTDWCEVWCAAPNVPLVRFCDRVRPISSTGIDLLTIADASPQLLEELATFDSIISWYGTNRPDFRRLVADLKLPFQFFPALPAEGCEQHAVSFYLDQVRTLTPCESDGIPRIPCTAAPDQAAPYAVIHPFSGSSRKNWPIEKFLSIARGLERRFAVRWCRGPEDPPLPGAVEFDDLYQLACWIRGAQLYIGNDSGITHLAAATGVPVLAVFGPTDPAVWAPRGPLVRVACWNRAPAYAIQ